MFLEYRKRFKKHEEIQISMFLKRKMIDFPLGNWQEIEEIDFNFWIRGSRDLASKENWANDKRKVIKREDSWVD